MTSLAKEVTVKVPQPYPLQQEIIDSPAKRKVIVAGRRAGKTEVAAIMAVIALLSGLKVIIASLSQDQSDIFWRKISSWCAPLVQVGVLKKNEVKRTLEMTNGKGYIRVKTGSDPDMLRGEDADLLIFDECAYLAPEVWYEVGAPILADRDGTAVFISTPSRRNWFFDLYNRAVSDTTGRWAHWNFSTLSNPHLSKEALAELINDMTEDRYKQEILAEFLDNNGAVFRRVDECCTATPVEPYEGKFVIGLDWAQKNDFTVGTVIDMERRCMVDMDRFNGVDWSLQRSRIETLRNKWKAEVIIAESNSIGSPNIEQMQREGLPVQGFETTGTSKPPLIESLVLAFERSEITCLNDTVLKTELKAYERIVSATTGRSSYNAPNGLHDDCVMSLALAWYGVQRAGIPPISFAVHDRPVKVVLKTEDEQVLWVKQQSAIEKESAAFLNNWLSQGDDD